MTDHERSQLTPEGEARRDEMLDELLGTMQRMHHRRRTRRRVGSTFAVLGVFAVVAWMVGSRFAGSISEPIRFVEHDQPKPMPDNMPGDHPNWQNVQRTGLIQTVGDDELVTLLAQLDRPAGIVRSEGVTWLTNAVTDEELGLTPQAPAESVDPSTM